MNKIAKAGITALSAISIAGGAVSTVTTVVEKVNYVHVHEATLEDKFFINGVEVSSEDYFSLQQTAKEDTPTVYYGAVDSLDDITFDALTCAEINELATMNGGDIIKYRCNISAGNFETDEGQYPVFILPKAYKLFSVTASGIEIPMNIAIIGNHRLYYFPDKSVDGFYGGINYSFEIMLAENI